MSQQPLFAEAVLRKSISQEDWTALKERALGCRKCSLRQTASKVVFGEGNIDNPPICFVGEGPGANEDLMGRPFVGRAGELLEKMIIASGYRREDIYICNIVQCRPPGNRVPEPKERESCEEWLTLQIRGIQPKTIVALGATAARALLGKKHAKSGVSDLRNRWFTWEGIPLRVSYHPAYLLRNPLEKPQAWVDLQNVLKKIRGEE